MPHGEEAKSLVVHIKTAIYLDPLTAETGALRVIPGSHHLADKFSQLVRVDLPNCESSFGVTWCNSGRLVTRYGRGRSDLRRSLRTPRSVQVQRDGCS